MMTGGILWKTDTKPLWIRQASFTISGTTRIIWEAYPAYDHRYTETLNLYPVLIWFTGYDWYAPIINIERDRILEYLDQGGRLILSSQDFLYYHETDALAKRLGVQAVSDGDAIMVVAGHWTPIKSGMANDASGLPISGPYGHC